MKRFVIFFFVMNLLVSSLSAEESIISFDSGRNSEVWKQLPAQNSGSLVRSLRESGILSNIREIRFDGVTATVSGNLVTLNNLRILSDTTGLSDYISADFLMDIESLGLIPANIEITKELGVYYRDEYLFAKDVTGSISMTAPTGGTLASDTEHSITATAGDEYKMYLEQGTVITMRSLNPTDDYRLQIVQPDGKSYSNGLYRSGSRWTLYGNSIMKSGIYIFSFVPQNKSSVTLQFGFTNNNRKSLTDISSGKSISVSLSGWGQEYAKYRLTLNAGDLVEVSNPSDDDIWLYLVNSNSQVVTSGSGEIYTRVYSGGDYYLFVVNKLGDSSSYYGSVKVTPDPDISKYPVFTEIHEHSVTQGQSFSLQLSASNSPTKFTAGGLPTGITVNETTGLISGTPAVSGVFTVRVNAENEFGNVSSSFLLRVSEKFVWDADSNEKWSLPDIIYGLQIITGVRNGN